MGEAPIARPPLAANFVANLQLRSAEERGRRYPVKAGYRPYWWAGAIEQGKRKYLGSRVYPIEPERIEPGASGTVRIEPNVRDDWAEIAPGSELVMFEASREYGRAVITQVRPYRDPENPWEEHDMDFSGATVDVAIDVPNHEMVLNFAGVKSHPEALDSLSIRLELGRIAFVAWSCAELPETPQRVQRFRLRPPDDLWSVHQRFVPQRLRWARSYDDKTAEHTMHELWEVVIECPSYRLQVLCDAWGSPELWWKQDGS